MDKLTDFVKGIGAKGLAWVRWTPDSVASSFGKFLTEERMQALLDKAGAQVGDVVLIVADTVKKHVLTTLGALRLEVAGKLNIAREGYNLLWITEFPFFEWDEEAGQYVAMHHPFTAPMDECIPYLDSQPDKVFAKAYDLVLNGIELASGSIRITDPELQGHMFRALGLSEEEAQEKFGFLTQRVPLRRSAPRRHGHRPGPAGDADAGRRHPAGCGALPQGAEHDRTHDPVSLFGGCGSTAGAGDCCCDTAGRLIYRNKRPLCCSDSAERLLGGCIIYVMHQ